MPRQARIDAAGTLHQVRCKCSGRVSRDGDYFGGLEPYDGKLSVRF